MVKLDTLNPNLRSKIAKSGVQTSKLRWRAHLPRRIRLYLAQRGARGWWCSGVGIVGLE